MRLPRRARRKRRELQRCFGAHTAHHAYRDIAEKPWRIALVGPGRCGGSHCVARAAHPRHPRHPRTMPHTRIMPHTHTARHINRTPLAHICCGSDCSRSRLPLIVRIRCCPSLSISARTARACIAWRTGRSPALTLSAATNHTPTAGGMRARRVSCGGRRGAPRSEAMDLVGRMPHLAQVGLARILDHRRRAAAEDVRGVGGRGQPLAAHALVDEASRVLP